MLCYSQHRLQEILYCMSVSHHRYKLLLENKRQSTECKVTSQVLRRPDYDESSLSFYLPVLLSIISVYYTLSSCTDHHLWRSHNYRGGCQKKVLKRLRQYSLTKTNSLQVASTHWYLSINFWKKTSECFRQACTAHTVQFICHSCAASILCFK